MSIPFSVPKEAVSLSRCLGRTNLLYTQYVNLKYHRSGRLWQHRFYSVMVGGEIYLWSVMRYIELNPVKAVLIVDSVAYPWSSCRATVDGIGDGLCKPVLHESERLSFREFILRQDISMDKKIRRATSTGRPFGDDAFTQRLEKLFFRSLMARRVGRPKK